MTSALEQIEILRDALETAEARLDTLEERQDAVEENVAAMKKLFTTWMDGQITRAKQSIMTPQQVTAGPIDEQQLMIDNARPSRGTPPSRPVSAPVKFGETYDAQTDRIDKKRIEWLGK